MYLASHILRCVLKVPLQHTQTVYAAAVTAIRARGDYVLINYSGGGG